MVGGCNLNSERSFDYDGYAVSAQDDWVGGSYSNSLVCYSNDSIGNKLFFTTNV